ncbi:MAG TPA: prepilin peptidase [Candidatus Paceibacterota bacterium]|jgi:prepilin signal peptidase PulO-like enzyme (type II secretory pathway)
MHVTVIVLFAVLGAMVASFLGVISERAYTGQSWSRGRSKCNSCRETLSAPDLIPVISWLTTRGTCRYCGSRLPYAYVITEALFGGLFVVAYAMLGPGFPLVAFLAALSALGFIVLYDLRHTLVPPVASFIFFAASLVFALSLRPDQSSLGLTLMLAGGLGMVLLLIHVFSCGRAMGLGDAPITFSLALLVGHATAFTGFLFSFWIGALFGIGVLLARRGGPTMGIEVPFVPFLAAGFLLAYFVPWNPFPFFGL